MLRTISSGTGGNPVKEKQEELTRSVNQEQGRLESLQKEVKIVSDDLEHIIDKRDAAAQDLEDGFQKVSDIRKEISHLETQKNTISVEISGVQSVLEQTKQGVVNAKQEAAGILAKAGEEGVRIVAAAESKVASFTDTLKIKQSELDSVSHECGRKKVELDRIITETQAESVVLRKLDQQVADRKRDLVNLDNAVAKQEEVLTETQQRVRQAQHAESDLNAKIEWQNEVLRDIEMKIEIKKEEDLALDERKIEFTKKEIQFKKSVERLKELYAKSGIPFDLEV